MKFSVYTILWIAEWTITDDLGNQVHSDEMKHHCPMFCDDFGNPIY